MNSTVLEPDDSISRCIIYDRAFSSGLHVDSVLFLFGQSDAQGASHESGVLRRLAPSDSDVHRIGCKIAAKQNARKNEPQRGPHRRYYCGFRTALFSDLPSGGEGYFLSVALASEDGEPSHVDFALTVSGQTKNERNTAKADAGLALAEAFGEPREHICPEDSNDPEHPLSKDPNCLRSAFPQYASASMPRLIG